MGGALRNLTSSVDINGTRTSWHGAQQTQGVGTVCDCQLRFRDGRDTTDFYPRSFHADILDVKSVQFPATRGVGGCATPTAESEAAKRSRIYRAVLVANSLQSHWHGRHRRGVTDVSEHSVLSPHRDSRCGPHSRYWWAKEDSCSHKVRGAIPQWVLGMA